MVDDNTYELIHRYLTDEMTEDEKISFEADMAKNEILKKETAMEKRFLYGLELATDAELKNTIKGVHSNLKSQGFFEKAASHETKIVSMNRRRNRFRILAIAASVTLLAVAWWTLRQPSTNIDGGAIFADIYQPEKNKLNQTLNSLGPLGFGGELKNKEDSLRFALDQYKNKNYSLASEYLDKLSTDHPSYNPAVFYAALSNIENNKTETAINQLIKIARPGNEFSEEANWYLALAYLKAGNKNKEAKNIFEDIAKNNNSPYKSQADQLLKKYGF